MLLRTEEIAYERAHGKCVLCGGVRPIEKLLAALEEGPYPVLIWHQTILRGGPGRILWRPKELDATGYAGLLEQWREFLKRALDSVDLELARLPVEARSEKTSPYEPNTPEDEWWESAVSRGAARLDPAESLIAKGAASVAEFLVVKGTAVVDAVAVRGSSSLEGT